MTSDLEFYTDDIFIGEPTGSSPNFIGEVNPFRLPYSGLLISSSNLYHQRAKYSSDKRIFTKFANMEKGLRNRYNKTLDFVQRHLNSNSAVLDLGTRNAFSEILENNGFSVQNTQGENLDTDFSKYVDCDVDAVCAFEIFEHMLAPFNILREFKTKKLIASVPLKLWFASAFWNEKDDWAKHYHEFEKKQFDFLLEKSGWEIKDSQTWISSNWKKVGIRPFLRHFTPRYYVVYCERKT